MSKPAFVYSTCKISEKDGVKGGFLASKRNSSFLCMLTGGDLGFLPGLRQKEIYRESSRQHGKLELTVAGRV